MRGDQDYVLSFGSLDFSPLAQGGAFRYFVTGLTRGQPSPVVTAVTSLLQNGSLERVDRYENRDLTLLIGVEGDDAAAMSAGEAALFLEAQKERNTLSWRPPGGAGATTVFRILWASLAGSDADDWDLRELQGERFYTLTLRAEPFARSATERTVTATPVTSTPVTLDPGTSTANWSSTTAGATLTTETYGGRTAIRLGGSNAPSYNITYSGPMPTLDYVGLVMSVGSATGLTQADGSVRAPVASEPVGNDGVYRRFWFTRPAGVSTLQFISNNPLAGSGGVPSNPGTVYIGGLAHSTGVGGLSLLAVDVRGSAPTDGRISVSCPSGLSWVTVFCDPEMAMGAYHPGVPATWANAPEGTYSLWIEPRVGSVVELTVTDAQGGAQVETLRNVNSSGSPFLPIGEFSFGGRSDGKVGPLTLSLKIDGLTVAAPTTPRLFRMAPDTSLVNVSPSGTAVNFTMESPSVTYPNGALFADGAPVGKRFTAWDFPVLAPPMTYLFVEGSTPGTSPITTTASYFAAWHTNAAE